MKDEGIDITIKNNSDHFLSPNDWDMVMKVKFNKISPTEYRQWYLNLIRERWATRKEEFKAFAIEGMEKDIKLKCFCLPKQAYCHAYTAAEFMNALVKKLQNKKEKPESL